jgi:hypothetical protein
VEVLVVVTLVDVLEAVEELDPVAVEAVVVDALVVFAPPAPVEPPSSPQPIKTSSETTEHAILARGGSISPA